MRAVRIVALAALFAGSGLLASCGLFGGEGVAATSRCGDGPRSRATGSGRVSSTSTTRRTAVRRGSFAHLVPVPVEVSPVDGPGSFPIDARVVVLASAPGSVRAACLLRDELAPATGLRLRVPADGAGDLGGDDRPIELRRARSTDRLGSEGYVLHVEADRVEVRARSAAGFGWAVQTLLQALPAEVESPGPVGATLALPLGTVRDEPRYRWRGLMLDVARHFFGPEEVERVIDLMARYKLNVLHLHLSDDQGWRIQIRAHPELTAVGGRTEVGGGEGGWYTQRQYRSLVAYARRRGITVVPEIDLPGHTNAALASLPALNCDGAAREPYTGMAVGFSSLCIGTPATDRFVDTVIAELAALTPGPWIHVGGDESNATAPDDYVAFVRRVDRVVRSHGKTLVGWDEIARADLGAGSVTQHWAHPDDTLAAARAGSRVVLSPTSRTYFDMRYGDFAPDGNSWAGDIDTRTAYSWDPATVVPGLDEDAILGIEAPLWTELVETPDDVDHRLLPRLPALAELGWSPPGGAGRTWASFRSRLAAHAARWEAAGRTWTPDPGIPWPR